LQLLSVVDPIRGLVGDVLDLLEDVDLLGQRAICGLDQRNRLVDIGDRLLGAADLRGKSLRGNVAGGVVGRAVDRLTRGQLLFQRASFVGGVCEGVQRVERVDVGVDGSCQYCLLLGRGAADRRPAGRGVRGDRDRIASASFSQTDMAEFCCRIFWRIDRLGAARVEIRARVGGGGSSFRDGNRHHPA
jgi:hypothetical protein